MNAPSPGHTSVLHVFGRMNRGGAEMRTLDILRRVDREQFSCHFLTLSDMPGDLNDEIRRLGGTVLPCPLTVGFGRRFARLVEQQRVQVVHSHVHHVSGYIVRTASEAGVPVRIVHFRNTQAGSRTMFQKYVQDPLMKRWINQHATHILGNGTGSLACGWRPDWRHDPRCAVIHNGLDTAPFIADVDAAGVRQEFCWEEGVKLIVHVGRMDPQKNHGRMIRMMAPLLQRERRVRLLIVGRTDAAVVANLMHVASGYDVASQIAIAGLRDDVPRLLKAADLMIFPSLYEGLPGAVLEACAAGVPVLASPLPGVREIADWFGTVQTLSLDQPDDVWVAQAASILNYPPPGDRSQALDRFLNSPYHIDLCVRAHQLAWQGAPAREVIRIYEGTPPASQSQGCRPAA